MTMRTLAATTVFSLLALAASSPAGSAQSGQPACLGEVATIVGDADGDGAISGTDGADVILGTEGDETIDGGGGDDRICGLGGDDQISGGDGFDRVNGGPGYDVCSTERQVNCEEVAGTAPDPGPTNPGGAPAPAPGP